MTTEELKSEFEKIDPAKIISTMRTMKPTWEKLFGWYNTVLVGKSYTQQNGMTSIYRHLGMGCTPCYAKVYSAIKKYLEEKPNAWFLVKRKDDDSVVARAWHTIRNEEELNTILKLEDNFRYVVQVTEEEFKSLSGFLSQTYSEMEKLWNTPT
jgi:hypothetical protein